VTPPPLTKLPDVSPKPASQPSTLGAPPQSDGKPSGMPLKPEPPKAWTPPSDFTLNAIPYFVILVSLLSMLAVRKALPTTWSIGDALSEPVDFPVMRLSTSDKDENGKPVSEPIEGSDKKPVMLPKMTASSSRLIAFMGMIVMLIIFIGFSTIAIYGFAKTGTIPDSFDKVSTFLTSGLALFAPYAVNKLAAAVKG